MEVWKEIMKIVLNVIVQDSVRKDLVKKSKEAMVEFL